MVGAGTGGIKPCVATFGGDQFKLPEQKKQSELFFSIFYWAVNLGSFISMLVTPQLRSGVACLGVDQCYPLAFGVPAVLMFVAVFFFLLGKLFNMYKINMPDRTQENLIKKTVRSIWVSKSCAYSYSIFNIQYSNKCLNECMLLERNDGKEDTRRKTLDGQSEA